MSVRSARLALSPEDAEMCLDNAKGLTKDSKKTSDETALALLELSMEECAKGIILLFDRKFHEEGFDPGSEESLSKIPDPELRALYRRHAEVLSPAAVRKAFKSHPVKLRQLEFVIELIAHQSRHGLAEVAIRQAFSNPNYPLSLMIRIALVSPRNRSAALTRTILSALQKVESLGVKALDQKKNEALYVGLSSDDSGCKFPEIDDRFLADVKECNGYLIQILDGMILALGNEGP